MDADECICEGLGNNCHSGTTCTNTVGSPTCACNTDFTGIGVVCADANECDGEDGGHDCDTNADGRQLHLHVRHGLRRRRNGLRRRGRVR